MSSISIAGRSVGSDAPVFIIAEAGVNHNGDMSLAKQLVDVAATAGADAVKFQTFRTENVVLPDAAKAEYQERTTGGGSQFEMIRSLELGPEDFATLSGYCAEKGIMFLSSPFDLASVDLLDDLAMPAFKVASGEITNTRFLKYVASKGKPVILSTGMATMEEITIAVEVLHDAGTTDLILLHCVTSYPAPLEEANLKAIATLRDGFGLPTGFSDHTQGIWADLAATALGACVIEKHFTTDKSLPGPDQEASLGPDELAEMVRGIRGIESAMGDGRKIPTAAEERIKQVARRSLVSAVAIPAGIVITEEMLDIRRPGTGIPPDQLERVLGMRARVDIPAAHLLTMDMLEPGA